MRLKLEESSYRSLSAPNLQVASEVLSLATSDGGIDLMLCDAALLKGPHVKTLLDLCVNYPALKTIIISEQRAWLVRSPVSEARLHEVLENIQEEHPPATSGFGLLDLIMMTGSLLLLGMILQHSFMSFNTRWERLRQPAPLIVVPGNILSTFRPTPGAFGGIQPSLFTGSNYAGGASIGFDVHEELLWN